MVTFLTDVFDFWHWKRIMFEYSEENVIYFVIGVNILRYEDILKTPFLQKVSIILKPDNRVFPY